jgi:hypothetical protein
MMLPTDPESESSKNDYQMIHIQAYVVHVDMVSENEVAFKLTPETIKALVKCHKEIYSIDTVANTWDWAEKDNQLKKLQEEFVQAANKFVYRACAQALEGLEEDGSGELLGSEDAKGAISALFVRLLPPPPRVVNNLCWTSSYPSSTAPDMIQQQVHMKLPYNNLQDLAQNGRIECGLGAFDLSQFFDPYA